MSRERTASLRRRPSSPAAGPLEDDDLLAEILLRLPPLPSSLPRASAVSKRWRSLASDPRFCSRFRIRHRRNPPLIGCFVNDFRHVHFQPALEAPNRLPERRWRLSLAPHAVRMPLGCRHGLLLSSPGRNQLLVWDSVIGDQHHIQVPPGLQNSIRGEAVLRAATDVRYFQVVLVGASDMFLHSQAVAYVYSSETSAWGNVITGPLLPDDPDSRRIYHGMSPVMVGNSLYWLLSGNSPAIIEFDLARQNLALIPMPVDEPVSDDNQNKLVMPAEGGGLGFLLLTGLCTQSWERKKDCHGVASWVLGRSIQLDKLLSLNPETERPQLVGFAEDNNMVFVWTSIGVFTVHLESLQFKKLFVSDESWYDIYPYEVVYTAEKGIGVGYDVAELLQNA